MEIKKDMLYNSACFHFYGVNIYHKNMLKKIKNIVNKELYAFSREMDRLYRLNRISPFLSKSIKNFITRKGKRIRPLLFIIGYLGFAKKPAPGLYRSSLSIELLHVFLLIHDDIIDKSDTRRGGPSMHKMLNNYLSRFKNIKFQGQDLSIVVGDILYAMAIDAFLSIKENPAHKELGLKKFLRAAMYTGGGEFIELLLGAKDIEKITKQEIYRIYYFKTAFYSFISPLSIGAALAGAPQKEIDMISEYGHALGTAFQIKDDILGMFGEENKIGKSPLVDLQEAKKTILIWRAYKDSGPKDKCMIKNIMSKAGITGSDLSKIRFIVKKSGALDFAENEISILTKKAYALIASSGMLPKYKDLLCAYFKKIY
jgi:geranylgeranyl diphosphate synthase type I